jgi:hypothetical protein
MIFALSIKYNNITYDTTIRIKTEFDSYSVYMVYLAK